MKTQIPLNERTSQKTLKTKIIEKAREGAFDRNPLLATSHQATCKTCGYVHELVYLHYLKSGNFEIGDTEMVEMVFMHLTIPEQVTEKVTPIIIKFRCDKCRKETVFSPISVEYLMYTATKPPKPECMYV